MRSKSGKHDFCIRKQTNKLNCASLSSTVLKRKKMEIANIFHCIPRMHMSVQHLCKVWRMILARDARETRIIIVVDVYIYFFYTDARATYTQTLTNHYLLFHSTRATIFDAHHTFCSYHCHHFFKNRYTNGEGEQNSDGKYKTHELSVRCTKMRQHQKKIVETHSFCYLWSLLIKIRVLLHFLIITNSIYDLNKTRK